MGKWSINVCMYVTVVWDEMEETSARGLTAPSLTLKIEKEAYVNRGASLLY